MTVDREEVLRIAALARLELTSEETERMATELSAILGYVAQLAQATGSDSEPASSGSARRREDRVAPSRVIPELLELAPAREAALVRVPRVIE